VLHVSLRDLAPEIVLASCNIVDDVEHCSGRHLAASGRTAHRAAGLPGRHVGRRIAGRVEVPTDRAVVFSPFGPGRARSRGGQYVYDQVLRSGELHVVDDFFHELAGTDERCGSVRGSRATQGRRGGDHASHSHSDAFNQDDLFVDLRSIVRPLAVPEV